MPFKIVRNDITKMKVDAIVNTANSKVAVGPGVDEAVYRAAGWDRLFSERCKIGPMERGSVAITDGFDLEAKYIIHAVGPKWDEEEPERVRKQLRDCYDNSMSLALEHGLHSIAFPLIATGNHAFPKDEGLDIAFTTISKYLYTTDMDVYLVVYDDEAFSLSKKLLDDIDEFIDSRYVEKAKEDSIFVSERRYNMESMPSYHAPERSEAPVPGNSAPLTGSSAHPLEKAEKPIQRLEKVSSSRKPFRSLISGLGRKKGPEDIIDSEKVEISGMFPEDAEYSMAPAPAEDRDASFDTKAFSQFRNLDDILKHAGETFQERLFRFIDMSGMSDVEVYKGANLSKQTFSKIKQPGHAPKKRTVLALALSMKLSVDDTRDLLQSAGQAFSPSDKVDLTVQYCMYNGIYNIFDVERILFEKFGVTLVS